MRKNVLIGAGLGLLLLAVFAGGIWVAERAPEPAPVVHAPAAIPRAVGSPAAAPSVSGAASQAQAQERRRRLSEVRAELNALRAQGMKASPEKMRALVDELEVVSPPGFDPRYFQAMRSMLDSSAKVQALNAELQGIGQANSPKDMARKEAILAEMRVIGERVSADARNLQSYAPVAVTASSPMPGGRAP